MRPQQLLAFAFLLVPAVWAAASEPLLDSGDARSSATLSTRTHTDVSDSSAPGSSQRRIRNVLFIVSDDLKASALGCYGNQVCKTPHIDDLARRGMVFERAYCQGVWCEPSRRSFMSSKYQGISSKTLGENFKDQGYYTARVGKIFHMRVPGDIVDGTHGKDVPECWTERFNAPGMEAHSPGMYACLNLNVFTREEKNRQSTRMRHRMFVSVELDDDGQRQPDYRAATKACELLDAHHEEPFFLAVGLVRPHYPMVAPKPLFEAYPWQDITLPRQVENDLDDIPKLGQQPMLTSKNPIGNYPDNQKRMWTAYYASVTFMDQQVGRILAKLDDLGLRESTAVVFTSDHGYHLGEHELWQKSNLHEEVTRVPLVVSAPGLSQGRTRAIAELVDIYPTVSDLCGLRVPKDIDGLSLKNVLVDSQATHREGAISFYKGASLRTEQMAYMRYQDQSQELYDMRSDPLQFHNLAKEPEWQEEVARLDAELSKRLAQLKADELAE
ncbi:MAG TPA: iduronate-2-sulfatase [Planctomycetaceae bacterium]|nr:iduronate-2-sulfatase [Planctomycetaceae bacterium]